MVEEYDGMWSSSSSPHLSNLYVQHMGVRAGGDYVHTTTV